jgi:hypothetical protein
LTIELLYNYLLFDLTFAYLFKRNYQKNMGNCLNAKNESLSAKKAQSLRSKQKQGARELK